jgi:hypothetical protein
MNKVKTDQDKSNFKEFQNMISPTPATFLAAQILCRMSKKMPKKKDRKNIEGDDKGFLYKAKTTTLNSFDGFIKDMTYFKKEDI